LRISRPWLIQTDNNHRPYFTASPFFGEAGFRITQRTLAALKIACFFFSIERKKGAGSGLSCRLRKAGFFPVVQQLNILPVTVGDLLFLLISDGFKAFRRSMITLF